MVGGHPFFFPLLFNVHVCEELQLEEQKAPAGAGTLHVSLLLAALRSPTQPSSSGPTDLFLHVPLGMVGSTHEKEGEEVSQWLKIIHEYPCK